jgi:hypothetical protein
LIETRVGLKFEGILPLGWLEKQVTADTIFENCVGHVCERVSGFETVVEEGAQRL